MEVYQSTTAITDRTVDAAAGGDSTACLWFGSDFGVGDRRNSLPYHRARASVTG